MTSERQHLHARSSSSSTDDDDPDVAPGRGSRSSLLQRKADANGVAPDAEAAVSGAATSTGASLPAMIQRKFESALGADLSSVRVHTGAESQTAAAAVGAKAYTVGQDIHFGANQYDPSSPAGQHLLAHEVAHTVQQRGGTPTRQHKLEVSSPHDAAEHEADSAADAMVGGGAFQIGAAGGQVQREAAPQPQAQDLVGTEWWIDWVNRQTGAAVNASSTQRSGAGDAAYGQLKIVPEAGAGEPVIIDWMNAAKQGAVEVGKMPHLKDKGGTVATNINYGSAPSMTAKVGVIVTGDAVDKKKAPAGAALAAKQQAASAAALDTLHKLVSTKGNIDEIRRELEAAANTALGAPPDGFAYQVQISLVEHADPRKGTAKSPPAKPYDKFGAPGRRTITIVTPADLEKLKGTQAAQIENKESHEASSQAARSESHSDAHEDSVATQFESTLKSEVTTHFQKAWERLKENASSDSTSVSGSFDGHLSGSEKLGVGLSDLVIDFGELAFAIAGAENPLLGFVLKRAFGKGKVGGDFKVTLDGDLKLKAAGEKKWSKSEFKRDLDKIDVVADTRTTSFISQKVQTFVRNTSANESKNSSASGSKDANENKKIHSSSTDTVGVKVINHDPYIEVTNK